MSAWYLRQNEQMLGPYSIEQLQDRCVLKTDFVWSEGMAGWGPAGSVPALYTLFANTPPPINTMASYYDGYQSTTTHKALRPWSRLMGVVLVFLLVLLGAIIYFGNSASSNTTYRSPLPALIDEEKANAAAFLRVEGTYHFNLINQLVVQGEITNKATHTNYKDVTVRVTFLSETQSTLGSQEFTLYKYVPYGGRQEFKWKMSAPAGTKSCGMEVSEAKAY